MDYRALTKRIKVPAGFAVPTELAYEDVRATVLGRADLDDDVAGINSSLELIRRTRGGDWPTEPVSEDFNFGDLVWHEVEWREGFSFSYVLREARGAYLGCCYLYPLGRRTELTEELIGYDVDVSWWVTTDAYERGYYAKVYRALRNWLETELPAWRPYFSNVEIPG